jgi:hypothetical protein
MFKLVKGSSCFNSILEKSRARVYALLKERETELHRVCRVVLDFIAFLVSRWH